MMSAYLHVPMSPCPPDFQIAPSFPHCPCPNCPLTSQCPHVLCPHFPKGSAPHLAASWDSRELGDESLDIALIWGQCHLWVVLGDRKARLCCVLGLGFGLTAIRIPALSVLPLHLEFHTELENLRMKWPRALLAFENLILRVLGGASID